MRYNKSTPPPPPPPQKKNKLEPTPSSGIFYRLLTPVLELFQPPLLEANNMKIPLYYYYSLLFLTINKCKKKKKNEIKNKIKNKINLDIDWVIELCTKVTNLFIYLAQKNHYAMFKCLFKEVQQRHISSKMLPSQTTEVFIYFQFV